MLKYSFNACGHKNLRATHKATLEFTKDSDLTLKGDCILGVNSDFSLSKLQQFSKFPSIKIEISVKSLVDSFYAVPNKKFNSSTEMVIRRSNFDSERTFAVRSTKSSLQIDRAIIKKLKSKATAKITISKGKV